MDKFNKYLFMNCIVLICQAAKANASGATGNPSTLLSLHMSGNDVGPTAATWAVSATSSFCIDRLSLRPVHPVATSSSNKDNTYISERNTVDEDAAYNDENIAIPIQRQQERY